MMVCINDKNNYPLIADYLHEIVYQNYVEALEYAEDSNDKLMLYNKMLELSELLNNYKNSIEYINLIHKYSKSEIMSDDLLLKWVTYNMKISEHDIIIKKHIESSKIFFTKIRIHIKYF